MGGVHRLQVGIALVQAPLLAPLVDELGDAVLVAAGGLVPDLQILVLVRLVYVVAEADDEVDVLLLGDRALDVVEARLEVLAGVEDDLDRLVRVLRGGRPEVADRRGGVLGDEAVEVLLVGVEALDDGPGGVVAVLAGDHVALLDDVAELAVFGDEQVQLLVALGAAEAGPEGDLAGAREAGGDPEPERAVLGEGNGSGAGLGRVVEGDRGGGAGGERADQEAAPAEAVRAVERLEVDGVRLEIHSSPPSLRQVPCGPKRLAASLLSEGAAVR